MKPPTRDFREFAFLATGDLTNVRAVTLTDLKDNIEAELDRLEALAYLLRTIKDEVPTSTVNGAGELVHDAVKRMRTVLQLASGSRIKAC